MSKQGAYSGFLGNRTQIEAVNQKADSNTALEHQAFSVLPDMLSQPYFCCKIGYVIYLIT